MTALTPFFDSDSVTIYQADSRVAWRQIDVQADAIITSPPYFGLRDYGDDDQLGMEQSVDAYVTDLADLLTGYAVTCLDPHGSLWLNLGDTYASNGGAGGRMAATGLQSPKRGTQRRPEAADPERFGRWNKDYGVPRKSLAMAPERVALALIERGWILRNKVVWVKPNAMPTSVRDRLATRWEHVFHFTRSRRYRYDLDAIRQPHVRTWTPGQNGQSYDGHVRPAHGTPDNLAQAAPHDAGANPGDVWTIPTQPYPEAHFAVFPPELVRRPILATVPEGGTVLDPFFGSGSTGVMARKLGRRAVGVELSLEYCELAAARFHQEVLL